MTASGIDIPTSLGGDEAVPAGVPAAAAAGSSPAEVPGAETVLLGAGAVGVPTAGTAVDAGAVGASPAGTAVPVAAGSAILLLLTLLLSALGSGGLERCGVWTGRRAEGAPSWMAQPTQNIKSNLG